MGNELSSVQISSELADLENTCMGVPAVMQDADTDVAVAKKQYELRLRAVARELRDEGWKSTAYEREIEIKARAMDEWFELENAVIVAKAADRQFKAIMAVMTSKENRNRIAHDMDRAHGRHGQG